MNIQIISTMTRKIYQSPMSLLMLLAIGMAISSCKSRKNLAQVTDTPEVIAEEIEPADRIDEIEDKPAEPERIPEKILSKEQKLNNYLGAVSNAASTPATNANIKEALTMFNSPDAPVLIVIYNDGANPDYDEPTTIAKYLDYLKDTKSKPAEVEEVVYDASGRIKELVLRK